VDAREKKAKGSGAVVSRCVQDTDAGRADSDFNNKCDKKMPMVKDSKCS